MELRAKQAAAPARCHGCHVRVQLPKSDYCDECERHRQMHDALLDFFAPLRERDHERR